MLQLTWKETIDTLDRTIEKTVKGLEYWGQLNISKEQFEIIREYVSDYYGKRKTLKKLASDYPYVFLTYAVFLAKYQYNGDFWGLMSSDLEIENKISAPEQSYISHTFLEVLDKNGFDYSLVGESRKYVNTILYEIGEPPESNLGDMFYIFKYGQMGSADPSLLIEGITAESYNVHKPLLHFFENFTEDMAVSFILDMQDTYVSAVQMGDVSGKYSGAYYEWVESEKHRSSSQKNDDERVSFNPYLMFESGERGLYIVLPRQEIEEEWVDNAEWRIEGDNVKLATKTCFVQGSGGKRFVSSMEVPVPICNEYTIHFIYDDGFKPHSKPFPLKGIDEGGYLYFDSYGRKTNQKYLKVPYGILIYSSNSKVVSKEVDREEQYYPSSSNNYVIEQIVPLGAGAQITIHGGVEETVLHMRPQIIANLMGEKIFGVDYIESVFPLFVKIPKLSIHLEGFSSSTGMEIRVGKETYALNDLSLDDDNEIDISDYFKEKTYGQKTIRIYQFGKLIRQIHFYMLPAFKTLKPLELFWPDRTIFFSRNKFSISKIEGWEFKLSNGSIQDLGDRYEVAVPFSEGVLNGTIVSTNDDLHLSVDFKLPICALKSTLISNFEIADNIDLQAFLEDNIWAQIAVYGRYSEDSYTMELASLDRVLQRKPIKLHNHSVNFDLSIFRDTINDATLPVKIYIHNKENGEDYNILVIKHIVKYKQRPVYLKKKNELGIRKEDIKCNAIVEKYGDPSFSLELDYEKSKLYEEKGWRGFPLPEGQILTPGYYRVIRSDENSDSLFGKEPFVVTLDNDQFYNTSSEKNPEINSFKVWLDQITADLIRYKTKSKLENLKETSSYLGRGFVVTYGKNDKDEESIECLVILGSMLSAKISDEHKRIVENIMRLVSCHNLTGIDRYNIIKKLINVDADDYVIEKCISNYSLFMFEIPADAGYGEIRELAGEIKNSSLQLSLLLLLANNSPIKETVVNRAYLDGVISRKVVDMMLKTSLPEEKKLEDQKHFLAEDGKSKVHICIHENISGKNELYTMVDEKKLRMGRIFIDRSKIPEGGIQFNGNEYTKLFVNWYIRNKAGEGLPEDMESEMRTIYREFKTKVYDKINKVKNYNPDGVYFKEYNTVLEKRKSGDLGGFSYPNFFYFVGIASLIAQLNTDESLSEYTDESYDFMTHAFQVAPYISERDYLLASLFYYLRKKEG